MLKLMMGSGLVLLDLVTCTAVMSDAGPLVWLTAVVGVTPWVWEFSGGIFKL